MNNIIGSNLRPRISVFRSNRNVFLQAIDDNAGKTIASVQTIKQTGKLSDRAKNAGIELAKKLKTNKIDTAIFDRGKKQYHGIVKNIAEGLRESGINI